MTARQAVASASAPAGRAAQLPYGVGRFTAGWYLFAGVLLALVALGAYAYWRQLAEGEIVTGMRNVGPMGGATWGLYVVFVIYFVGVSFAGITVAALIRLLNLTQLRAVARMAELLTVIALLLAAFSVLADLGQPLRGIVNLFRYARPQSPFFGTFTLVVAGYLFASLVYLYLDGRRDAALCARMGGPLERFHRLWAAGYRGSPEEEQRHARASFWLAIAIVPLLITAHSTLGFVFGLQVGRPGWFSPLQPPAFVILAGVSGVGLLIVIAAILRHVLGEREKPNLTVFSWLGNLLMLLVAAYLYFMLVEWLTTMYAAPRHEAGILQAILTGEYAWLYWASVVLLLVPFVMLFAQFVLGRFNLPLVVLSGLLVNLAAVGKRYLIVIPSQTHGALLPYGTGSYAPSWVEYAVVAGLFALGTLLYALFVKLFPILDVPEGPPAPVEKGKQAPEGREKEGSGRRRGALTLALVLAGFALQAVSYFLLAAPIGTPTSPAFSNPRVPFAPTLFILGVIAVFLAAVVYELLPERENP